MNSPEFVPLSEKARDRIEKKTAVEVTRLLKSTQKTGVEKGYKSAWNQVGAPLTSKITGVARAYQGLDVAPEKPLLPFPRAVEQGLVIGSLLAKNMLMNTRFKTFELRVASNLSTLDNFLHKSPYNLEDVVRLHGKDFAQCLTRHSRSDALLYSSDAASSDSSRIQELFVNSIGYMGQEALTILTESEIRRAAPTNHVVEAEIRRVADILGSESLTLTSEHITAL